MEREVVLLVLVGLVCLLAAALMFAMFRGAPFERFEMSRLYFAAGTLAAVAFLFALGFIFYAYGPEHSSGEAPGKAIFTACVNILPPIATLIIGFYFGSQQRSNESTNTKSMAED